MTVNFIPGDPPSSRSRQPGTGINYDIAAKLRTRPGVWAHVRTFNSGQNAANYALLVRTGRVVAFTPSGTFEAVSRKVGDEQRVYARFVGA